MARNLLQSKSTQLRNTGPKCRTNVQKHSYTPVYASHARYLTSTHTPATNTDSMESCGIAYAANYRSTQHFFATREATTLLTCMTIRINSHIAATLKGCFASTGTCQCDCCSFKKCASRTRRCSTCSAVASAFWCAQITSYSAFAAITRSTRSFDCGRSELIAANHLRLISSRIKKRFFLWRLFWRFFLQFASCVNSRHLVVK